MVIRYIIDVSVLTTTTPTSAIHRATLTDTPLHIGRSGLMLVSYITGLVDRHSQPPTRIITIIMMGWGRAAMNR